MLPEVAAVYAIYFDQVLVYIGSSVNVKSRIRRHNFRFGYGQNIHTPWGELPATIEVGIKIKPSRRLGDWAMSEIRLIARLRPEFNQLHKGRLQ